MEIRERELQYTDHFLEDVEPDRPKVTFNLVETYLVEKLDDLLAFTFKPDPYDNPRYNLCFRKSRQYYLLMAISFTNGHINLITSFPVNQNAGKPEALVEQYGVHEK